MGAASSKTRPYTPVAFIRLVRTVIDIDIDVLVNRCIWADCIGGVGYFGTLKPCTERKESFSSCHMMILD